MRSDFDQIWSGFDQILIKIVIFRLLLIYKRKWSQMASGFHRIRSDCDPNRDASLFAYIAAKTTRTGIRIWSNVIKSSFSEKVYFREKKSIAARATRAPKAPALFWKWQSGKGFSNRHACCKWAIKNGYVLCAERATGRVGRVAAARSAQLWNNSRVPTSLFLKI